MKDLLNAFKEYFSPILPDGYRLEINGLNQYRWIMETNHGIYTSCLCYNNKNEAIHGAISFKKYREIEKLAKIWKPVE